MSRIHLDDMVPEPGAGTAIANEPAPAITPGALPSPPPSAPGPTAARLAGATPGEFGLVAVLAAGLGLYSVASGVEADRAPLVVVGAAAWAVLAVGIVWPIIALRRVSVTARAAHDTVVGDLVEVSIDVAVRGAAQVRTLDPPSPWHYVVGPTEGVIRHTASRRGVFTALRVEVRSGAPLGVFIRRRVITVPLGAPLAVAPRPVRMTWRPQVIPVDATRDAHQVAPRLGGDAVRSVRPYVAGDPARLVHWPSSARRASLVVRELEPPPRLGLAIVVDLRAGGAPAEAAAARAAGLARAVLVGGGECLLLTCEASTTALGAGASSGAGGRPVVAAVHDVRQIGRRLAAAVGGPLPTPPEGWPTEVVS